MLRWRLKGVLLVLLVANAAGGARAAADDWTLEREEEGIRVYTRPVEGSDFREFRGETVVEADLNRIMALLDDTPACVDWMYRCKTPKLIYKASLMERYQYLVNDFPWPAADRDMVVRNRIRQDPGTRVTKVRMTGVSTEALPERVRDRVPPAGDDVRVTELEGFFELTPLQEGGTRVVYQMYLDPGGTLAAGVVNNMIVDNPFETLRGMREVARRDKYRCFNPF